MGAVVEDAALKQEVVALRDATRELPKLRNEVGQLRVTRIELDRAREENARLLNAKQTGAPIPREAPPGFTSKERLTFAGFSTPENAVETFFWAMREGGVAAIFEAMSPENEDRVRFEQSTPEYREELAQRFRNETQMMKHFNDFTIAPISFVAPRHSTSRRFENDRFCQMTALVANSASNPQRMVARFTSTLLEEPPLTLLHRVNCIRVHQLHAAVAQAERIVNRAVRINDFGLTLWRTRD